MVPALRYRMWLVWMIYNGAQFFVCMSSTAAAEISIYDHPDSEISTLGQAKRGVINSNLVFQVQQLEIPTEIMQGLQGGTNWKKNFLCRTLGRCLLAQESASSPPNDSPGVPVADDMDIPPMTLPTLPTDPESPPPPAPHTNPSTLLTPNSHPSGSSSPGAGGSSMVNKGSNMANKVSISAGVGVSAILLVIVALLYYFKPDIFMCCKTCVRVQVFHHSAHPTRK